MVFFFSKTFSCFWNFIFSPNFVVDGKINLIFSNEKMHKVQMCKVQMLQTSNVNVGDTSLSASDIPISENSSKNFFKRKNTQSSNVQTSNAQTSNVNVSDTSSPASDIPIFENSSKRL
jgi:hypothetical protein